jgi:cell division cycle 14
VTRVIRLNESKYDKNKFIKNGINHSDLFFIDGSTPPENIV